MHRHQKRQDAGNVTLKARILKQDNLPGAKWTALGAIKHMIFKPIFKTNWVSQVTILGLPPSPWQPWAGLAKGKMILIDLNSGWNSRPRFHHTPGQS